MIAIKPISQETALVFRDIRLRALQDSPAAFSSTFAKESQLSDAVWIERASRWSGRGADAIFLAFDDNVALGIVGSFVEPGTSHAQIVSMWVDPAARRLGVGKALIAAVFEWNRSHSVPEVRLMVTSTNQGAIEFYERIGFRMTGLTGPYPNDPAIFEYEMALLVGAAQPGIRSR